MNSKGITPFSTLSLRKWCRMSICLVREWLTGFLDKLIALLLSQYIGDFLIILLKSLSVLHIDDLSTS